VRRIRKHCEQLAEMPESSPRRDNLGAGIRTLSFERRVLIIYRIEGQAVRALHILYAGQDYPAGLPDESET
jgi:toxin ParE1/3/4